MAVEIIGTSNLAGVNSSGELKVAPTQTYDAAGFVAIVAEVDPGTVTGTRYVTQMDADDDYRLRTSVDSIIFQESFAGAALNSAQWTSVVTTMTTSVGSGYLRLNNGTSIAANAVARVQSYRSFSVEHACPLYIEIPFQYVATSVGILNNTTEVGWYLATGTAAPTDGVFMRINAAGEIRLVASYNGAEIQSDPIAAANLPANTDKEVLLVVNTLEAELWFDNVLVAKVDRPSSVPNLTVSSALPITFRTYNGAVGPATSVQVLVGPVTVQRGGIVNPPTAAEYSSLSGWGGYQGQSGGTMGQTANYTNSAAPTNATLSNTAAGYTTLGGQFAFAAPAGAETDFALFGYQVPAMAAGSYNRNILIKGVRIASINTGAAVATTATILQWAIAVGSTAVSLATAEAATTKAPRRVALGMQGYIIGAAIGQAAADIFMPFAQPLLAEPGSFIHVIVRVPVGTATASQVIRGTVAIDCGFF